MHKEKEKKLALFVFFHWLDLPDGGSAFYLSFNNSFPIFNGEFICKHFSWDSAEGAIHILLHITCALQERGRVDEKRMVSYMGREGG